MQRAGLAGAGLERCVRAARPRKAAGPLVGSGRGRACGDLDEHPSGGRIDACHRGCGWIQVIQDRLFPSVRPILDYLFPEAADLLQPEAGGSWDAGGGASAGDRGGSIAGCRVGAGGPRHCAVWGSSVSSSASPQVYVLKRPYVDEFLRRMGELFECVLFTASLAKVAGRWPGRKV